VLDRPTISPAGAAPDPDGHLVIDLVLHLCGGGAVVHDTSASEDGTGTEPPSPQRAMGHWGVSQQSTVGGVPSMLGGLVWGGDTGRSKSTGPCYSTPLQTVCSMCASWWLFDPIES
jgi:hypothetical protein